MTKSRKLVLFWDRLVVLKFLKEIIWDYLLHNYMNLASDAIIGLLHTYVHIIYTLSIKINKENIKVVTLNILHYILYTGYVCTPFIHITGTSVLISFI